MARGKQVKKYVDDKISKETILDEKLANHIITIEERKMNPEDDMYKEFLDFINKNHDVNYRYCKGEKGICKEIYDKDKITIINYDDFAEEIIMENDEFLEDDISKILYSMEKDENIKSFKKKVNRARKIEDIKNAQGIRNKFKAFIKHDRMLGELQYLNKENLRDDFIINNEDSNKEKMNKVMQGIGFFITSPAWLPVAISVYSLVIGVKAAKLVAQLKSNEKFVTELKKSGYYDEVMSALDGETKTNVGRSM